MPLPMGDVIVVLPGILGSALAKDGKEVWAPSGGAVWRFLKSRSASIKGLALDSQDDGSLDDLGDGVTATRLMPDIHLVPAFWAIDGYSKIRTTLLETFTLIEGANYFEFPYDWRRSNRAHGRRLRKQSEGGTVRVTVLGLMWSTQRADQRPLMVSSSRGSVEDAR